MTKSPMMVEKAADSPARLCAERLGYKLVRSHQRPELYKLVDRHSNIEVCGFDLSWTLADIETYLNRVEGLFSEIASSKQQPTPD